SCSYRTMARASTRSASIRGTEIQVTTVDVGLMMGPSSLGREFAYAVVDGELVFGTADRLQFDVYSSTASLVRSVRAPDVDVALTPEIEAIYRAFMDERLDQTP